jgi:multiple sugar transport system permease protein
MPTPSQPQQQNEHLWWVGLSAPCLLGLLVFTYGPSLFSLGLAFTQWDLLGTPKFVGLQQAQSLLTEPLFWQVVQNTLVFVVGVALLEVLLALMLAWFLFMLPFGRGAFSTLLFLPYVTPMIAVSLVFGWLYEPETGLLNQFLMSLHFIKTPIAWLYTQQTALGAVMGLEVWKFVGYNTLLLLSGLQAVPTPMLEAALLDGAKPFSLFVRVLLPMLSPTLFFVSILTVIHSLQAFDAVYLLTQGGPEHASSLVVYWVFKNAFEWFNVGRASTLAFMLFIVVLGLTLLQWWGRTRWVQNEEEAPS